MALAVFAAIVLATGDEIQVPTTEVVSLDAWPGAAADTVQSMVSGGQDATIALAWDVRSPHAADYRAGKVVTVTLRDGARLDLRVDNAEKLAGELGMVEVVADRDRRVRTWRPAGAYVRRGGSWYTHDGAKLLNDPRPVDPRKSAA